ncbi:MAG: hypothetical protein HY865_17620 [Chloroflexi bacterium]|nr:hypothetical protein [Chloroflexota bacterium]
MTKKLQNYIVTISGVIITILLSLVSGFFLRLPPEITWLTFSTGASITVTLTLLEQRLLTANSEEINKKLELYRLLDTINDDELQKRAHIALEQCRTEIDNLSKGVFRIDSSELHQYLIQTSNIAKRHIIATHVGIDEYHNLEEGSPSAEQSAGIQQWYAHKMKLLRKGINFERIYILSKNTSVEKKTGQLKVQIQKYLEKQQKDGISISIVWQEDLEKPDLIQDISIFDDKVVLLLHPAWKTGFSDITVYKRKFDVEKYTNLYYAIRSKGHFLSKIDKS